MPSHEKPVETAEEILNRNITPFYTPGGEIMTHFFANHLYSAYQKISEKLVIPDVNKCEIVTEDDGRTWKWCSNGWDEYQELVRNVTSTGEYALLMGNIEENPAFLYTVTENYQKKEEDWKKNWYRSTRPISLYYPYTVHLSNKKWPLKKVM